MTNDQPKAPMPTKVELYISDNYGDNYLIHKWDTGHVQDALQEYADQTCADKQAEIDYLKEIIEDKHKLTKYIDDILNGKMAADKPSLIDVIKSVKKLKERHEELKTEINELKNEVQEVKDEVQIRDAIIEMRSQKHEELKARAEKMYSILDELSSNSHFHDPRVIPEKQSITACDLIREYESIDKGNKSK